jgi:hypothetical protein
MPSWAFKEFIEQLPFQDGNPCHSGFEFEQGDLTFVINGVEYPIPSHHWVDRNPNKNDGKSTCTTYLSELNVGPATMRKPQDDLHISLEEYAELNIQNMFILGDLFMTVYYSAFDRDTNMIGFAKAKHTQPEVVYYYNTDGVI